MNNKSLLALEQTEILIKRLKDRFENNVIRHPEIDWSVISSKLESSPWKLWTLNEMERTGGEPDVIGYDNKAGEYLFCDCSPESPKDRRSLCYDREALESRKENQPANSALEMATDMGIELLSEEEYRFLQKLGHFDEKTSSWIKTPETIRKLGGALFGDYRYGQVFVYHNSAPSYYSSRGFRGLLRV
jgi:hypothetical protein